MAKSKKASKKHTVTSPALSTRKVERFGWVPDLPDQRDFLYAAPAPYQANTPKSVDLRKQCPPVYDQGQLGSCTANAIAAAIEFDQIKASLTEFTPSRLFIYYNERSMEGTINSDAGAQIRDGIKSVATLGAPPESDWPYNIAKFTQKPPNAAYTDAKQHLVVLYQRLIQELNTLKGCLASGFPFVFGFTCYESFESKAVAKSGILPMPGSGEKVVGGHAVVCVGYDDASRMFWVRNSWGKSWGVKGYFKMPYSYLTNPRLASDLWTIRSVQ
ncbi:xylellain [Edaphobacter aggregans]|jgi:C1A family cysteine protease|uniref:Xylellain n=1 Tax=Edaphobacter aggregans TaxID=570835 RepID=A0A3R9P9F1_9BACT|nr:C1 family peptidase [Edaphobacter aggregans]RSL16572.1 xylellain [Edaphobacter aggregans]